MTEHSTRAGTKSTTGLVADAIGHITGLVRKEIDLVKAEVSENAHRAAVAVGLLAGGVVFVLVALNVLSAALVAGISELGLDAGWSALIVGVLYLIIAIILARKGTNDLKRASLAPTRAAQNVRQDALILKEKLHG